MLGVLRSTVYLIRSYDEEVTLCWIVRPDRYLSRYMSLLSAFDDAALEKGVQEITEDRLEFPDTFAFVLDSRS